MEFALRKHSLFKFELISSNYFSVIAMFKLPEQIPNTSNLIIN